MNEIVLTLSDFKQIHNALCNLRRASAKAERSDANLAELLQSIVFQLGNGLADAYVQNNTIFQKKLDYFFEMKQANELDTEWSIYEVDDLEVPHCFQNASLVQYEDGEAVPICKTGPGLLGTWLDLWRAANLAITKSGDKHHIFVERFTPSIRNPHILQLTTGS
jgi:hypothetical protein